ncbi:hypothetical protein GCM10009676_40960 [Prauserella halophila]|uniref:PPE family protein n=1 Tax=Prauserella halophila TaxID=185641 RepID=A0ABP4H4M4_9PSEU|nr:hypothetical protein [Prauserella halophila]MCP2236746.1 hypothetical protein [Prauserella halophila]
MSSAFDDSAVGSDGRVVGSDGTVGSDDWDALRERSRRLDEWLGADGLSTRELLRRVKTADTSVWWEAAQVSRQVAADSRRSTDLSDEMTDLLESGWTGDSPQPPTSEMRESAAAARRMADVYDRMAEHYAANAAELERLQRELPDEIPTHDDRILDAEPWYDGDPAVRQHEINEALERVRELYGDFEARIQRSIHEIGTEDV